MRLKTARRILSSVSAFALMLLVITVCTVSVMADENLKIKRNQQTGYAAVIIDGAQLLSDTEEDSLIEKMVPVTQYATVIFVGTEKEYSGNAVNHARAWLEDICGTAELDAHNAVIFMIDMHARELAIYSGEATAKTVTGALADSITDNVYTYAGRQDYHGCAISAFDQIFRVLEGEKIAQPMRYITAALLAIFTGLGIALILIRVKTGRKETDFNSLEKDLTKRKIHPDINSALIKSRKVLHVEVRGGSGFGGGGRGGPSGLGGGGFFGGGGGGGGFRGSSGHGSGGSHKF
ncbi:MAG: TPM domain-containing protein [Parasporobacterium sp.]|nr:TPM domain-containing protein [Parasporobacterium sp.]